LEILGHEKEEIDLSRLNAGAAVLYNHDRKNPAHHLGIVEKAWVEDNKGCAIIRLSKRGALDGLWQDITEGILKHVSVGYLVKSRLLERGGDKANDTYRITHWQPHEISLVTVPADPNVGIGRSDHNFNLNWSHFMENPNNPVTINTNEAVNIETRTSAATDDIKAADIATSAATDKPTATSTQPSATPEQDTLAQASATRQAPTENLSIDDIRQSTLQAESNRRHKIRDKFRQGVENALLSRAGLAELETNNEYQNYKLAEIARASLNKANIQSTHLDSMALVGRAFTHSSSDFPAILSNIAYKAMLKGYQEIEETFTRWTSTGSLTDFKISSRVDINAFSSLSKIPEGAEYQYATLGEHEQTIQLATYGAMFTITRQAIINDDLGVFTRIPRKMGQAALRTVGNLVYAILTDNPKMADGLPLFSKDHHNIAVKKAALNVMNLTAARVAMATQKLGDVTLNIRPKYCIVPVALEGQAKVLMASETDPEQANARVPNPIRDLSEVIADARLDSTSPDTWYLIADPNQFDVLEVAYLDGQSQPTLEKQDGWLVDGITYKVRLDAGVKALDHRSFYRGESI